MNVHTLFLLSSFSLHAVLSQAYEGYSKSSKTNSKRCYELDGNYVK